MTNESIRAYCLALPHTTEVVQWESHLLFKVGGKMFAMIDLDGHSCSLRCDPERYAELVEMPDIVPTSHNMWKYHWATMETLTAVPDREFRDLLEAAYRIVRGTLPKGVQAALDGIAKPAARPKAAKKTPAARKSPSAPAFRRKR